MEWHGRHNVELAIKRQTAREKSAERPGKGADALILIKVN